MTTLKSDNFFLIASYRGWRFAKIKMLGVPLEISNTWIVVVVLAGLEQAEVTILEFKKLPK